MEDTIRLAAEQLARAYYDSLTRPRLHPEVIAHWDALIDAWAEDATLPLFIRKKCADDVIGCVVSHDATGRSLAPCDNSPAHWSIVSAFSRGVSISLADVRTAIAAQAVPVTMAMSNEQIEACQMKGVLAKMKAFNAGTYGWKVDHIEDVGLKRNMKIKNAGIEDLKAHFKRLMKPSNIVLVPSVLKGLGDMPAFLALCSKGPTASEPLQFCGNPNDEKAGSCLIPRVYDPNVSVV